MAQTKYIPFVSIYFNHAGLAYERVGVPPYPNPSYWSLIILAKNQDLGNSI